MSRMRRNELLKIINGNTSFAKVVRYDKVDFEMIDVNAIGACFYNALSVALAYHNEFFSPAEIKKKIWQRMLNLNNNQWFTDLFNQYSFTDERAGTSKYSLQSYINKQKRITAWAGMLEVIISCHVFRIEINTFVRGAQHRQQHLAVLQNTCALNLAARFTVNICFVRSGYFDATTGLNHYVFLRPVDLLLSITHWQIRFLQELE